MNKQVGRILGLAAVFAAVASGVDASEELSAKARQLLEAPVYCRPVAGAVDASGKVTIKPGNSYCFRMTVASGRVSLAQAEEGEDPAKLLTVRLIKESASPDHFLYIKNGSALALKYSAALRVPNSGALNPTSTCPVPPGAAALEHWPFAFSELTISSVNVLKSLTNVSCD
jgi:hypothetical protein